MRSPGLVPYCTVPAGEEPGNEAAEEYNFQEQLPGILMVSSTPGATVVAFLQYVG